MVTWNRREYFERTIAHLFSDSTDFRIYIWDNGSQDGVRDLIADLKDDRIELVHYNPDNGGQFGAWQWFMANCKGDIVGKLDDDILGEPAWMRRFSEIIADSPQIGVLGAWVYLKSEWDEVIARPKIVQIGPNSIFQNGWVPGGIFLGRRTIVSAYSSRDPSTLGVPVDQLKIAKDGLINGYPLPMSFAEHLDDPRSPYCRMNRAGGWDQFASYTARMRKFSGPEEYGRWIAADARSVLETPLSVQISALSPSPFSRLKTKISRKINSIRTSTRT